jgi:hypothetical protein
LTYICRKFDLPTGALYWPLPAGVQPVMVVPLVTMGVSVP